MLFNRNNNGIEELKEVIPVSMTSNFRTIKPFIAEAEKVVTRYLSKAQYDELDIYYNTVPFVQDDAKDKLISKIQKAVGNLAYFIGFDILILKFGDSGIHINKNENIQTPHLRQEVLAKKKFQTLGYNAIDELLEFLEENKTSYPTWSGSDASTFQKKFFLRNTNEFNSIVDIKQSRLIYMASLPYQTQVNDFYIITLIGRELYDELKTQMVDNTLTPVNKRLLEFIQKAVAHLTVYKGGYELALLIMDKFYAKLGSASNALSDLDAVDDMYLKDFIQNAKASGLAYLQNVEGFLRKNIADYPLYEASTAYNADGSVFRKFNNMGKKIVTM